jgi:very-short-patch-repair endonuclease
VTTKPPRASTRPIVRGQPLSAAKIDFAKRLRRTPTPIESLFWHGVRANRLRGLHFRRQQPIGEYVVDFYCEAARLVIELDGSSHELSGNYDDARDRRLERFGIKVVHVSADEFRREPDMVLGWILECARAGASESSRV